MSARDYSLSIYETFDSYLATWMPNERIEIGQFGRFDRDRVFRPLGNIADFGVPIRLTPPGPEAAWCHCTGARTLVHVEASAGGEPIGGRADTRIAFGRSGEFLFEAPRCRVISIAGRLELKNALQHLHRQGVWDLDYICVDAVVVAASATIIVSLAGKSEIHLRAAAGLSLAAPEAALSIAHEVGSCTKVLAQAELTPLFRASKLERRLLLGPDFSTVKRPEAGPAADAEEELALVRAGAEHDTRGAA